MRQVCFSVVMVAFGLTMPFSAAFAWSSTQKLDNPTAAISDIEKKVLSASDAVSAKAKQVAKTLSEQSTPAPTRAAAGAQPENVYCPEASTLRKKNMLWFSEKGGWRSYDSSFVKKISKFSGAEWVGVKVGKIICIYTGSNKAAFPVTIERDNLVSKPDGRVGGKWSKNLGGYMRCDAAQVTDCPFRMVKKKSSKNQSVYEVVRGLKSKVSTSSTGDTPA